LSFLSFHPPVFLLITAEESFTDNEPVLDSFHVTPSGDVYRVA